MNQILGKNHTVRAMLYREAKEPFIIRLLAPVFIAWSFYSTRTAEEKNKIMDFLIGIPALICLFVLFFFALFL